MRITKAIAELLLYIFAALIGGCGLYYLIIRHIRSLAISQENKVDTSMLAAGIILGIVFGIIFMGVINALS